MKTVPKRIYTVEEASHYLGRSVPAVRAMIREGKFPFIKDGRRVLLDVNDLDHWIDRNKERFDY